MSTPQPPIVVPSSPPTPGRPPAGMIPAEAAILQTWLIAHAGEYDTFAFNVRVGFGADPGPNFTEDVRKAQILNTQRRVDCLLLKGDIYTIVEVKVRGSLHALGQLMGYQVLWRRDNPGKGYARLLMLCASIDADAMYVYEQESVPFQIVIPLP